MLTAEEVATLTDEEVAACASAHLRCPTDASVLGLTELGKWRNALKSATDLWPGATAKAEAILAAREMRGPAPTRHRFSLDEVRAIFGGKPAVGINERDILVIDDPMATPSLPDAADELFRFLCGLDGTVTARWLSVEDQREFERLRRGLGEALMAMGRGRR